MSRSVVLYPCSFTTEDQYLIQLYCHDVEQVRSQGTQPVSLLSTVSVLSTLPVTTYYEERRVNRICYLVVLNRQNHIDGRMSRNRCRPSFMYCGEIQFRQTIYMYTNSDDIIRVSFQYVRLKTPGLNKSGRHNNTNEFCKISWEYWLFLSKAEEKDFRIKDG